MISPTDDPVSIRKACPNLMKARVNEQSIITMNTNLLLSSISDSNDTLALSIPREIITTTRTINPMSNERIDSTYIGPDMTLYSPLSTLSWPTVSQMRTVSKGLYLILELLRRKPTSPRCVSGCTVEA